MQNLTFFKQIKPYIIASKEKIQHSIKSPLNLICFLCLAILFFVSVFPGFCAKEKNPNKLHYFTQGALFTYHLPTWKKEVFKYGHSLYDFAQLPGGETVIIGSKGFYLQFQTKNWGTPQFISDGDLFSIDIKDGNGFIVGEKGKIFKLNKDTWEPMESPTYEDLLMVKIDSPQYALAVGKMGVILEYNGKEWSKRNSPVQITLNALTFTGEKTAIIVGDFGTILHITSSNIIKGRFDSAKNTELSLYGISFFPPDQVTVVGDKGIILNYRDKTWYSTPSPEFNALHSILLTGKNQGFIAGDEGTLLVNRNNLWQRSNIDYNGPFNALKIISGNTVLLGGKPYLKKLSPPSPSHPFGTDFSGKDIYTQMIYGARGTILTATLISLLLTSITIGLTFLINNTIFMGKSTIFHGIPSLLLAIVIYKAVGWCLPLLSLALLPLIPLGDLPSLHKCLANYKSSAGYNLLKATNCQNPYLQFSQMIPYFYRAAFVLFVRLFIWAIILESGLSFLGLANPNFLSWGSMLGKAFWSHNWFGAWWWFLPPGLALTVVLTSANILSVNKGDKNGSFY